MFSRLSDASISAILWALPPSDLASFALTSRCFYELTHKVATKWMVDVLNLMDDDLKDDGESVSVVEQHRGGGRKRRRQNMLELFNRERIILSRQFCEIKREYRGFRKGNRVFSIGDSVLIKSPQTHTMGLVLRIHKPQNLQHGKSGVIHIYPFCTWDQTFLPKLLKECKRERRAPEGNSLSSVARSTSFPESRQLFLIKKREVYPLESVRGKINVSFVTRRAMDIEDFHRLKKLSAKKTNLGWFCRHTYDIRWKRFGDLPKEALAA